MALISNLVLEDDRTITYWSVDQLNVYWGRDEGKTGKVTLAGYRSENAKKEEGKPAYASFDYTFPADDKVFPFTKGGDTEREFYEWLKSNVASLIQKHEDEQETYRAAEEDRLEYGTPNTLQPPMAVEERFALFLNAQDA